MQNIPKVLWTLFSSDLPLLYESESTLNIRHTDSVTLMPRYLVENLILEWERKMVPLSCCIQRLIIHTHPPLTILLGRHHHWGDPLWIFYWIYEAGSQQLVDLSHWPQPTRRPSELPPSSSTSALRAWPPVLAQFYAQLPWPLLFENSLWDKHIWIPLKHSNIFLSFFTR